MRARRGFTLAELCIVMAVLGILLTMVVSFSTLMNKHAVTNAEQYTFLEESGLVRDAIEDWIAEKDVKGKEITVKGNALVADGDELSFRSGKLSCLDGEELEIVHGIVFEIPEPDEGDEDVKDARLIKCTVRRVDGVGDREERVYVFSLRAATAVKEGA